MKKIILLFLIAILSRTSVFAVNTHDIEYAKNHLIILVHGIGDKYTCFDKVKAYLEDSNTYDLKGYVYAYQFSDPFLNIEKEGWEFGDRTYDNPEATAKDSANETVRSPWEITKKENNGLSGTGKNWLEQAREDFKVWYFKQHRTEYPNYGAVPDALVPQKFIVIAHSMGGLAVRSYILGKDHSGQRYYQDDIEKLITIDTPHTGSGGASFAYNFDGTFNDSISISLSCLGLALTSSMLFHNDKASWFFASLFAYSLVATESSGILLTLTERHQSPALNDMLRNSSFMSGLTSASLGNFTPVKEYQITGRGVPTPLTMSATDTLMTRFNPISLLLASIINILANPDLDTFEGRIAGAYMTMLTGYPFFNDGDGAVERRSQLGEGVMNIMSSGKSMYTFRNPALGAFGAGAPTLLSFLSEDIKTILYIATALALLDGFQRESDTIPEFFIAHGTMKDKIVLEDNPNMLEKALFDTPAAGSSKVQSVNAQSFHLLTNLTREASGKIVELGNYVPVEIQVTSEAGVGATGLSIVISGQEKQLQSYTVKEPPTKISGVLRDFMPKKMHHFQYSENFAAWKEVKILDEWGNFEIAGLKLAEGQNVIAFRAENKAGYHSNQILKIVLNTIPMVASELSPLPGTHTNNNRPTWSAKFGKAGYSSEKIESIHVKSATLVSGEVATDVTGDIIVTNQEDTYGHFLRFSYTPQEPLPDGHYTLIVEVESNVGVSRVVLDAVIDTIAPVIRIEPQKPVSFRQEQ